MEVCRTRRIGLSFVSIIVFVACSALNPMLLLAETDAGNSSAILETGGMEPVDPSGPAELVVTCQTSTTVTFVNLDFVILADYSDFYSEVGAYDRVLEIYKRVVAIYSAATFAKPVSIRLHRIYQFVGSDPISASTDPNTFINSIRSWKLANAPDATGALIALTARTMDAGDFGEGFQSTLCTASNVGFISEAGSNINYAATITGHVLGHIGGMMHDTGSPAACPTTGYLMSPTPDPAPPGVTPISACSITAWNGYVSTVSCTSQAGSTIGDVNCDCARNSADVDALVLALLDPAAYQAAFPSCGLTKCDLNGDGSVDGKDIRCYKSIQMAGY